MVSKSQYRVLLVVPSGVDLPPTLFFGDRDYHEGWLFDDETEAINFARKAVREFPGVVVGFDIYGREEYQ